MWTWRSPTLYVTDRHAWREWLAANHAAAKEIWLIAYRRRSDKPSVPYLDAVEEALCFGWIDGIAKKLDAERTAQRFTPRRPKSNWTELNKERARRLIASGQMTAAGMAVLPDLTPEAFVIPADILAACKPIRRRGQTSRVSPTCISASASATSRRRANNRPSFSSGWRTFSSRRTPTNCSAGCGRFTRSPQIPTIAAAVAVRLVRTADPSRRTVRCAGCLCDPAPSASARR
jgi:hypothetical protein